MNSQRIIIPGGSGFLGRTLAKWFSQKGTEVVIFSRNPKPIGGAKVIAWDARTLGPWKDELEGATALINLAGRSVNCRYHKKNRKLMMASRTESTRLLGKAISSCQTPPPVWLNSSTATIYRHRYEAPNTEANGLYGPEKEAKDDYSLQVAHAWEDSFTQAYEENELSRTRGILLRTAMVFGNQPGGVYETLRKLARLSLGGTMGHGRQYVSWIHEDDFCRAIEWLITNQHAQGIYNLTAPHPLPNQDMMQTLRQAVGTPFGLPATRWMLEVGAFFLRTETELIVKSRRVEPARLLSEGFQFQFKTFSKALESLQASSKAGP